MKSTLFFLTFILLGLNTSAQNTSGGISGVALVYNNGSTTQQGFQYNANLRTQFSEALGGQFEVGFGNYGEDLFSSGVDFVTLKASAVGKVFDSYGMMGEIAVGAGFIKSSLKDELSVIGHSEIFLSTKLSNNIVFGIPISLDYVFYNQDYFYSVGASLRYHF